MKTALLHQQIEAVCPIQGIRIGKWEDSSTWQFFPKPEATPDQISAAEAVLKRASIARLEETEKAMREIKNIEAKSLRAIREAILTGDHRGLQDTERKIVKLREKLK